jgi:hypothetical protein
MRREVAKTRPWNVRRHPPTESTLHDVPLHVSGFGSCFPSHAYQPRRFLDKAEAFAAGRKIAPQVAAQLAPRARHVSVRPPSTDCRRFCQGHDGSARRCRGPKYDDNEKTFAELKARITKTVKFVEGFKPGAIDGSEHRDITGA